MLASQRALFEMPRDICYLNSASWSPLPLRTQEAARAAVGRKGTPWTLDAGSQTASTSARDCCCPPDQRRSRRHRTDPLDQLRRCDGGQGSDHRPRRRVIVLENDHSSPVLEWQTRTNAQGFAIETVRRPDDGDWTSAVLAAVERSGAPPVSLASISWCTGPTAG